jgi:hypothetical protein
MYVCQSCAAQFPPPVAPEPRVPALTLGGGVLGSVAAVLTGQIILIPVAMFAGFLGDLRRCSICGTTIPHDAPAYRFERRQISESAAGRQGDPYPPRSLLQDVAPAWTKTSPLIPTSAPSPLGSETLTARPALASMLRLDEFEDPAPMPDTAMNVDVPSNPEPADGLGVADDELGAAAGEDASDTSAAADSEGASDGDTDGDGDM